MGTLYIQYIHYTALQIRTVQCNGLHNNLRTPGLNSDEKEWMRMSSNSVSHYNNIKIFSMVWAFQYDGTFRF